MDDLFEIPLDRLTRCFEGAVPAVVATVSAAGVPNITYLSKVHRVDGERIALSNQFFSKTTRNLAENPRASLLLVDPETYDQFRLSVVYERTERRGFLFDRLRQDVDVLASVMGMQDVFKLRAVDVYRVTAVEMVLTAVHRRAPAVAELAPPAPATSVAAVAELTARLGRCGDLDAVVGATVDGLAQLLGYGHSKLLLVDEDGQRLYTIASHGYDAEGVGSEIAVGEGVAGVAAARCTPVRVGGVSGSERYGRIVRRSFEETGGVGPEIPVPRLEGAESQLAVPAVARGQLVGVLVVESRQRAAFDESDEAALAAVATVVAHGVEMDRLFARADDAPSPADHPRSEEVPDGSRGVAHVRFFSADGSTFVDGDYLIKGVAGRILWSLLRQHGAEGRVDFTNKEIRLDPSLELPEYRDNLESRLILLKRRLDERAAPFRIEKTGRGRLRLVVDGSLRLEEPGGG